MQPYHEKDGITIYCCDCRDVLGQIDLSNAICVTDPPYGISHSSSRKRPGQIGASWSNSKIANDGDTSVRDTVLDLFENAACFGTYKTPPITGTKGCLVWDKGPSFGMGDLSFPWKLSWELIYIKGSIWSGRRDEGVLRGPVQVSWESKGRVHPHQKPSWISEHIIGKAPSGTLIIDPFMGSGPTVVAAKKLGFKAIGIEIEEKYCRYAVSRLKQNVLFSE